MRIGIGTSLTNSTALGGIVALPEFAAAVAAVKGGSSDALALSIGDSTAFGAYSTGSATGEQVAGNYPTQLAALINASVRCKANSFMGAGTADPSIISGGDGRVVLGSGWGRDTTGSTNYTLGGVSFINSTTTNNMSFTPSDQCDTFDVYYTRQSGSSSFNLNINGGSNQLVSVSFSGSAFGKATITQALGNNTLNIARVSGTVRIIGVIARNSAQKEISLVNCGWSSGFASYIADETFNGTVPFRPLAMITALQPKLVILNFGINEASSSFDLATYKTLMKKIIDTSKAAGASVLLYTFVPRASAGASRNNQIPYKDRILQLASEYNLPCPDIWQRWVSQVDSSGFYGDASIHPNSTGYADVAGQLFGVISKNL
jgi:hypothetical protein